MSNEQWMPKDTSELMSAIEQEWQSLMEVVSKLDEAKMSTPDEGGWTPKDNLAHLAEWLVILMGYHMDKRPAHEVLGVPSTALPEWKIEVINPLLFERNRNRSTEDVLNELRRAYAAVTAKLNATPFEDLFKPRHAHDPEKSPLMLWVLGDTTEHFAEHRETIEKIL